MLFGIHSGDSLGRVAWWRAGRIVVVLAAVVFTACGEGERAADATGSANASSSPGANARPSESAAPSGAPTGKFSNALAKIQDDHKNVEGREGILAEERLYSNFDEELIIRDYFRDRREGFFLDVGCAKPIKGSNTYYLEKHLGWTGIGVDALADYGPAWIEERPNSRFRVHLVSDQSGRTEKFYKSYGIGISSTDQEWAKGKAFGADFPTEEMQIETITLDELLARENVTKIDLLSMDIEGHEPKALLGFEIERFRPELVVIEGQTEKSKEREIAEYFDRHGYERIERYRPFDTVNDYYRPKGP